VVHCLKCKDLLQQAFDCYLMSTICSRAASSRAKQFFTVLEIEAAVALLDMAVVPKLMRWLTRISAIKLG
jgi:hypothetical protein